MKRHRLTLAGAAAALACIVPPLLAAQASTPQHPIARKAPTVSRENASFTRLAPKLHTEPATMEREYASMRKENPKLTRDEYMMAAVLAQNLSAAHPSITTAALLTDIKKGKSFRRALEGSGLPSADALTAVRQADGEVRAADKGTSATRRDSTKTHGG